MLIIPSNDPVVRSSIISIDDLLNTTSKDYGTIKDFFDYNLILFPDVFPVPLSISISIPYIQTPSAG